MNLPRLPQIVPYPVPKLLRVVLICSFVLFLLLGLPGAVRTLPESPGAFWLHLIVLVVLGALGILLVLWFWSFLIRISRQNSYQKLEQFYSERGYCPEMAETLRNIMPEQTRRDSVLRAFLLAMAEDYEGAERSIIDINETALLQREYAMLTTAKLRIFWMTARPEKFEHILENNQKKLDDAYEMQPDLLGKYCEYADDALVYFMLMAGYARLTGNEKDEQAYRKKAEFQISNRSSGEMECYQQLLELNALYAAGKTAEAHTLEQELYALPERTASPMTTAQISVFRTAVEQSRIYASHQTLAQAAKLTGRTDPVQAPDDPAAASLVSL